MNKSSARKSAPVPTESMTLDEATGLFAEYATADAQLETLRSKLDADIVRVRQKYDEPINQLVEKQSKLFDQLKGFAMLNKSLFSTRKSIELNHGVLGFRTSPPALKLLKGFQWAAVLNLLKSKNTDFIRVKEEVDKEQLIARREEGEIIVLMKEVGVEVKQDETFYVEPKKESTLSVVEGGLGK